MEMVDFSRQYDLHIIHLFIFNGKKFIYKLIFKTASWRSLTYLRDLQTESVLNFPVKATDGAISDN